MQEISFVDKQCWSEGPWMQEPDKVSWVDESTGLDCLAKRNNFQGVWCGYVGLPKGHSLFGVEYNAIEDIEVHGDLTFSGLCDEDDKEQGICHLSDNGESVWWFGFDCGHGGDICPGIDAFYKKMKIEKGMNLGSFDIGGLFNFGDENYRDLSYVKAECKRLAAQLKSLGEKTCKV